MPRIEKDIEKRESYQFPKYSNKELWALNEEFDTKYNGANKIDDLKQWYVDNGALSEAGGIIYDTHPAKYEILRDKFEKACYLQGKKEFAVRKELEEMAKLAEQMTVDSSIEGGIEGEPEVI